MLSRRLIRIRVMQTFYSYLLKGIDSAEKAEHQLFESLDRTYDLYFYLLQLIIEIVDFARFKIQKDKQKFLPTYEDLHPNTKFIENKLVAQLKENLDLQQNIQRIPYNWNDETDRVLIKKLYNELKQSEFYQQYMNSDDRSYSADKQVILDFIEKILYNSDDLFDNLEEKNLYWADSVDYILAMVYKTVQHFSIGDDMRKPLMKKFKNPEDAIFARNLLINSILKHQQYLQILEDHIANWDIKRLAQVDIVLLILGLHELLYMEEIPIKVTLNEYIEIAKHYSTEKSPSFINGILDKIVKKFQEEKLIVKTGKGLL